MPVVWNEFPEINRKVAFLHNYVSPNMSLGCHCGSISGLTINFGTGYYAANDGMNIKVLDTKVEKQVEYTTDQYSFMKTPPRKEIDLVVKYIRDKKFTFDDLMKGKEKLGFSSIVEACSAHPLWVMSDVINYDSEVRKPKKAVSGGHELVYEVIGHTADFAKYLIDNKIGYVLSSPIIQNPLHRSRSNYSLNQGWFWIPPKHLARAIDVAEVSGEELIPDKQSWATVVGGDLALMDSTELFKKVFDDEEFPKVQKPFQRKRGKNGQFLPQPHIKAA